VLIKQETLFKFDVKPRGLFAIPQVSIAIIFSVISITDTVHITVFNARRQRNIQNRFAASLEVFCPLEEIAF